MNRLPSIEISARRADWIEGQWITLADREAWCFPPTSSIAGYDQAERAACNTVVDSVLALLNTQKVRQAAEKAKSGDPSAILVTVGQMFALYQKVFFAGSALLKRNYTVTDSDCERLMPFNYHLTEIFDPNSKVHQTTPEVLAKSNEISKVSGIDVGPELARITSSN